MFPRLGQRNQQTWNTFGISGRVLQENTEGTLTTQVGRLETGDTQLQQNYRATRCVSWNRLGENNDEKYTMHALVLLSINQYTKFEVPSFTNYKDMIGVKFKK